MLYYPILKGRLGEWIALEHMLKGSLASMFATIEIPPVELKYEDELGVPSGKKKTVAEHVGHFSEAMLKHLPKEFEFGIDGVRCLRSTKSHATLYQKLIGAARDTGRLAIPVTSLQRNPYYQKAIQEILPAVDYKIVVRIGADDLLSPTSTLKRIDDLASTFGWRFDRLTLLIDLKQQLTLSMGPVSLAYQGFAEASSSVNDFARIGLVMTSMNDDVTKDLKPFHAADVSRRDLDVWREIRDKDTEIRLPGFGDYGVASPLYPAVDFRMRTLCGKIRYSLSDRWVVFRGKKIEKKDNQFHRLAQMVTSHPKFAGLNACWGDKQISDCSTLRIGPGTLRNWVSYTANHHLTIMPPLLASAV